MIVELLAVTPSPEEAIEVAGRTCYQSHEKIGEDSAAKLIRALVKSGHHSVLEHAYATFRISGCSRAMTHQLVRHRLMAISQESQRYVDERGIYARGYYVTPRAVQDMEDVPLTTLDPVFGSSKRTLGTWYDSCIEEIDVMYRELQIMLKAGKEKGLTKAKVNEDARFLLPNACASQIVISANFRELRHIFTVRCDIHAQWEIRGVALEMLYLVREQAPTVFEDFAVSGGGWDTAASTQYPS